MKAQTKARLGISMAVVAVTIVSSSALAQSVCEDVFEPAFAHSLAPQTKGFGKLFGGIKDKAKQVGAQVATQVTAQVAQSAVAQKAAETLKPLAAQVAASGTAQRAVEALKPLAVHAADRVTNHVNELKSQLVPVEAKDIWARVSQAVPALAGQDLHHVWSRTLLQIQDLSRAPIGNFNFDQAVHTLRETRHQIVEKKRNADVRLLADAEYEQIVSSIGASEFLTLGVARDRLKTLLQDSLNQGLITSSLNPEANNGRIALGTAAKLAAFVKMSMLASAGEPTAARASIDWVTSQTDAVFMYHNIESFGAGADAVFEALMAANPYFKNARRVSGPSRFLITEAFEKETNQNIVTLMWKDDAHITDDAWFELPDNVREQRLRQARVVHPTQLKPEHLAAIDRDFLGPFEMRSKLYEIDPKRLDDQIRQAAADTGESDAIHLHQRIVLRNDRVAINKFNLWHKQVNDWLTLRAMEEGLHPDTKSAIKSFPLENARSPDVQKNVTVGLRPQYRYSSGHQDANWLIVGNEFRDVTRKIDDLFKIRSRSAESVQKQVWERAEAPVAGAEIIKEMAYLSEVQSQNRAKARLLQSGLNPEFAATLVRAEASSLIPMLDFENALFYNYRTGSYSKANQVAAYRISEARKAFLVELKKLEKNWIEDRVSSGLTEEDLTAAVRMVVISWAKGAKASSLYSEI